MSQSRSLDFANFTGKAWCVTGVAGFIGSHLLETLLREGQRVIGIDNFLTGRQQNLDDVRKIVGEAAWKNFSLHRTDVRDCSALKKIFQESATAGHPIQVVLHQAALGSVPRSVEDPLLSHEMNVTGFVSMLVAAKESNIRRVVYASSSAVYGDCQDAVKSEANIGSPLSPYGATKRTDEVYAQAFSSVYQMDLVGLRYFNVFGPRQDPDGPYAAVIPRWIQALVKGNHCLIYGDGETNRDFCYVGNVVQANLLAAVLDRTSPHEIYNIAVGVKTSLNTLYSAIVDLVGRELGDKGIQELKVKYEDFREGDIRSSLADISKACSELGFAPSHTLEQGLAITVPWFIAQGR